MIDRALAEIEDSGSTLVDTMEQAGLVIEAASERWPVTTERYGWDCTPHYDETQKRWRLEIRCLTTFGLPEENESPAASP